VWSVVAANTQTRVSEVNPVLTVKGTDTAVQVSSADFYISADGVMRLRTPVTTSSSAGAPDASGRRRLLQADSSAAVPFAARTASTEFEVVDGMLVSRGAPQPPTIQEMSVNRELDAEMSLNSTTRRHLLQTTSTTTSSQPLTAFAPVCDWTSFDLYNPTTCASTRTNGASGVPFYHYCKTMQGSCSQFKLSAKMSINMLSQGSAADGMHPRNKYYLKMYACPRHVCFCAA
jgi:hypothetical protein